MATQPVCSEIWNLSNVTVAEQFLTKLQWSGTDRVVIAFLVPIIVFVGVSANFAFIFTVARVRCMRTVTNLYLVNLSIADVLFMSITVVTYVHTYLYSPFRNNIPHRSKYGCWANAYPIYLSYYSSILIVTLVSLERFLMICMPVKHRLISGKNRTIKLIATCWGLSIVFAALTTPRFGKLKQTCIVWPDAQNFSHLPDTYRSCYLNTEGLAITAEFIQSAVFLVTLSVSCITYFKLIQVLNNHTSLSWSHGGRRKERNTEMRNQIARLLIINGIVFFACQFPARVINTDKLIRVINDNLQDNFATLFAIANALLLINSAVNPFIYGLSSRFYRVAFCEAFGIASYLKIERSRSLGGFSFSTQSKNSSYRFQPTLSSSPVADKTQENKPMT